MGRELSKSRNKFSRYIKGLLGSVFVSEKFKYVDGSTG
jgi:hypothetical protein